MINVEAYAVNPFRTAAPLWGQTTQVVSTICPRNGEAFYDRGVLVDQPKVGTEGRWTWCVGFL